MAAKMSTNGKTLKLRAAKLKGFTVYCFCKQKFKQKYSNIFFGPSVIYSISL